MNVLSLFDGMSCGQIALEKAKIKVTNYFASEIDKYAIQVTKHNYPNTKHIGNVLEVKGKDLPKIDLLIGGSPCQGFSFAGKQLNFDDPRSKLFFEFVRLLKECKPKYFLLENVKMKKEYQNIISKHLGVAPVEINSALVSSQNRKRLYWCNWKVKKLYDKGVLLKDVTCGRMVGRAYDERGKRIDHKQSVKGITKQVFEVNKNPNKTNCISGVLKDNTILDNGEYRYLTPIECERLQTLPDNYTEGVSNNQRYKMLGNGWTVDVIAHIFTGIGEINENNTGNLASSEHA